MSLHVYKYKVWLTERIYTVGLHEVRFLFYENKCLHWLLKYTNTIEIPDIRNSTVIDNMFSGRKQVLAFEFKLPS